MPRLNIPTKNDITALNEKIADLTKKVEVAEELRRLPRPIDQEPQQGRVTHCVTLPCSLYNDHEVTSMPLIKRYANRKLYDTESKRYITLDGIAEMIRQQQDVKVIDHETGEDITALTQAQIIFEQERKLRSGIPHTVFTNSSRPAATPSRKSGTPSFRRTNGRNRRRWKLRSACRR